MVTLLVASSTLFAQSYWEMKKEAYQLYKGGDKKEAMRLVDTFIVKHPKEYKAKNLLAVFHYWSGDKLRAKRLLEDIVAHTNFPEAAKLLKKISKKTPSYKAHSVENKKSETADLDYLLSQIDKNPNNIQNRVLLAQFYMKTQNLQKAYDLAYEVLEIDPHHKKMKRIVQHLKKRYKLSYIGTINDESVVNKSQAKAQLRKLHKQKRYNAYYNLYQALRDADVMFSKEEYIDILHTAIMIGKYKEAETIIKKGLVPVNKYTLKVQLLLSKKLSHAVASR